VVIAGRIFISYRRSDTSWAARALFERLRQDFPGRVFIDVESIALGHDFVTVIDEHLATCEAMLALIGATWLDELNERRDHPDSDFVRVELSRALSRGIAVVPVLLDGARMPRPGELPDDLRAVTRRNGLPVSVDTFDSQVDRLVREIGRVLTPMPAVVAPPVPAPRGPSEPWMADEGHDQYGRWADLRVGAVLQRMRWIEPGEFWMGSTEAERRRFGEQGDDDFKKWIANEGPRHRVRLTQGFWLADTACTQALWQTVTGDNPSHFTGDLELPVESVSWDNVTTAFLPALNARLSGATARLPTEAQWEYACRAGTESAYSFGELIDSAQANFDGNHPPPGGKTGPYRERTVAVKTLPANAWGLYQMHGNVREWCDGSLRSYDAETVENPSDGQDQKDRALRGGAWFDPAKLARSAYRLQLHRDDRFQDCGFRFALRSIR
jgi:formylglycine-generating enzyme required for sulfatase activity